MHTASMRWSMIQYNKSRTASQPRQMQQVKSILSSLQLKWNIFYIIFRLILTIYFSIENIFCLCIINTLISTVKNPLLNISFCHQLMSIVLKIRHSVLMAFVSDLQLKMKRRTKFSTKNCINLILILHC